MNKEELIEAYKQFIGNQLDDAGAHYDYGVNFAKLGMYKEAIEAFKEAIRIRPDYATAHYNIRIVYLELGDRNDALREHSILKNLDPQKAKKLFDLIYK